MDLLPGIRGGHWSGRSELWLDVGGNEAIEGGCELSVDSNQLSYSWSRGDKHHEGRFTLGDDGSVYWSDSFHQAEPVRCVQEERWSLLSLYYTYPAGEGPDWGWRLAFSQRPDSSLVLQMTNIAPWGEEQRAVRMIFSELG
ncbi:MAG: hypothetical protein AAF194_09370 [Pseudomonadota bacterium]